MGTVKHKFKYKKKFDIKGTADLTPSLDVDLDCEFDLDGAEVSLASKIEKNFAKEYEKLIKAQISFFQKWLKDKQKYIDEAKALAKTINKMGPPRTEGEGKKLGAELNKLDKMKDNVTGLEDDFATLVKNWGDNVIAQQALIAIDNAKKQAKAKVLKDKKTRMVLGKVVKGVLLVSAIAVGVAAIVLSAGTAAPLVLGLTIAAASLSGIGGIVAFGKTVARDNDIEKKLLKNVESDLKKIQGAMAPIDGNSLVKHVTELEIVIQQRKSELSKLKMEMKKTIVQLEAQVKAAEDLANAKGMDNLLNDKEFRKYAKSYAELRKEADSISKKIEKASSIVNRGEKMCRELKGFGVKLEEFSKYYQSSSIGGNLKTYFTSVDGYVDLAKSLGAFRPGAGLAG